MFKDAKIYIAGHSGLVGSSIVRLLEKEGYTNLLVKSSVDLDLRNQHAVEAFFRSEKPEFVFHAAATVGGIHANNSRKAEFLYDNLMIAANVIHAAKESGVAKLLFLGSSCVYPKFSEQPIKESSLLQGALESTNEPYAIAKIAGIKLCQSYREQHGCDFISVMPTNLYGPNDNFSLDSGHVLPALMRRIHEAKMSKLPSVEVWGDGTPLREFLHVDDLAEACLFLMQHYSDSEHINVGSGEEISIADLAGLIADVVGYQGDFELNTQLPNGTPRKLLDCSKIEAMGWRSSVSLLKGIESVYKEFLNSQSA